ncbi:MAG: polysaccharide biosynthesis protein, partial [Gallionella sp.]
LGAGDAAIHLAKDLVRNPGWQLVGFLDDDDNKQNCVLHCTKVLGKLADLEKWVAHFSVEKVILAMPSSSHQQRKRAIQLCQAAGVEVLSVPSFDDLMSGKVGVAQLRAIELDDLLGRDPVSLDKAGLQKLLAGKVALVTGAGGSIGSELCRQIALYAPSKLVLFEQNEFALYTLEQELKQTFPQLNFLCIVGDVRDAARVNEVFAAQQPATVFHAAAYKHVPMMEQNNAWQAIRNNVFGTYTVARAALDHNIAKFVLVSTDKAVNPTNVMGASKRLAELVCQALQPEQNSAIPLSNFPPMPSPQSSGETSSQSTKPASWQVFGYPASGRGGEREEPVLILTGERANEKITSKSSTRFVMVRFGNVLGSTGSVIPKFRAQIAAGGPITVTHPDITRFFMSIPEAAQLVLQAGLMGQGGEIFVLDMGEPVKIVDLAKELVRLSGMNEDDIKIEYSGLRPGEKLYEELLADDETTLPTPHPKLFIAQAVQCDMAWLERLLLWAAASTKADTQVRADLTQWVPEYQPFKEEV